MSCWIKRAKCGGRELEHSGWRRVTKTLDIFMGWPLKGREEILLRLSKMVKESGREMRKWFRQPLWSSIPDCLLNHILMILTEFLQVLKG